MVCTCFGQQLHALFLVSSEITSFLHEHPWMHCTGIVPIGKPHPFRPEVAIPSVNCFWAVK